MQLSVAAELARFGPDVNTAPMSPAQAADYCRRLAQRHYENFTVASWLLPRSLRPHFHAIYAYCRWADDLADEIDDPAACLRLTDWWESQLERCYAGEAEHPVFIAIEPTIRQFAIPIDPFRQLLVAFRQDQRVTRYDTIADLLAYCRNSANPVGRLVLYLGRCHDAARGELSDAVCTGLQLANFCQDIARDFEKGRIYLPRATWQAAGYTESLFAAREMNAAFRQALKAEVDRAEEFLRRGEPLVEQMPRELMIDVALFVAGGLEILQAIRAQDYDVWRRRPTVSRWRQLALLGRSWWRSRGRAERPSA